MDSKFLVQLAIFCALLGVGFFWGSRAEKWHFASIRRREQELGHIIVIPGKVIPAGEGDQCRSAFVCGSVVIATDYFKTIMAMLINLFGGSVTVYETLVERARREAILRMKAEAELLGSRAIHNVKFSTANLLGQQQQQAGCVEVVAYGTALVPLQKRQPGSSRTVLS